MKLRFICLILKKDSNKRLNSKLNFNGISNANFSEFLVSVNLKEGFSEKHQLLMENILLKEYKQLIFFQEQDPFLLSIIKYIKRNEFNGIVSLFQDGLKPYNEMKGISLGMLRQDIKTWWWMWKNGIKELKPFKLLSTKKYAYSEEIDVVHLTFPDAYRNWNNKKIDLIQFVNHTQFKSVLEKVFVWEQVLLQTRRGVIFYLTQPMHHDAMVEVDFLQQLVERLNKKLILKLHPLTSVDQINKYRSISKDIEIIDSKIPAELFIMNLSDSLIVSQNSTSLFYHTPGNKYYYISNLFLDKIKRLKRYRFRSSPAKHIIMVNHIDQLK